MACGVPFAFLACFLLLSQPLTAISDFLSPLLSPIADDVCKEVECGKGTCKPSKNSTLFFECECDPGWKQTRFSKDDSLMFLPCIVPNCTLDHSCSNAPSPAPEKARKTNASIFDACHWVDCGGGSCNKTSTFSYNCVCDSGFYNLLNVTAFPCFRECSLGLDCKNLGISISNSSSSAPPASDSSSSNDGKSAPPALGSSSNKGKFKTEQLVLDLRILRDYAEVHLSDTEKNRVFAEFVTDSRDWAWDRFDFLIPNNVSSMIAAVRPPSPMFPKDTIIWRHTQDGIFSTRSAYRAISRTDEDQPNRYWRLLWKWKGMERIRSFLWLCGHDRLLTNEARKRRGLTGVDTCSRCGTDVETLLHTLRDCRKVKPLWMKLVHPSHWHVFFGLGRMDWLEKNLSSSFGRSGKPWESVFAIAAWIFWKIRNAEIFQSQEAEITNPVNHVLHLVDSFTRAQSRQDVGFYKHHVNSPVLVCWQKPESGWVKINVDAARQETLKKVACGGVARDWQGNVLAGFTRNIGECSTLAGELWAILHGLEVAWSLVIKKVHLESNSLMAVNLINHPTQRCHPCFGILFGIKQFLQHKWSVRVDHVYREGNMAADAYAKYALAKGSILEVFSVVPAAVTKWIKHDADGVGLTRSCLV
ncbi:protein lin-12 [Senna tora]|uniref:Protein lin-12 n=1 Tax=Senna tora TaxID=362788 RepID=A0A834SNL2_9FABA|nr:protein lin-12 [Senna tora]